MARRSRQAAPPIPAPEPTYPVAMGDRVRVRAVAQRADGLLDVQEFEADVVLVDPWRFEYLVTRRLHEVNVLHRVHEGGFSRQLPLETVRRAGLLEVIPADRGKPESA